MEGLGVTVGAHRRAAVRDVSFTVGRGEAVGLVGESGSGKTLTCRSVLGLLPPGVEIAGGRVRLGSGADEVDLTTARRRTWDKVRGVRLGAVFQDPASYLNPSLTVGHQLAEVLRIQRGLGRGPAHARSVELFAEVGLRDPDRVFHQYPHELSGGMLQRVLIAIAVSLEPELLIADEATTALDVVVQAEILQLLSRLRRTHDLSLLLVTHDLAVVADTCDRVLVMYGGEIVESGPTEQVLRDPRHPYTRALLAVASIGDWSRRTLEVIPGSPPEAGEELPGCRFAPRCRDAVGRLHRRAGLADHLAGREPVGALPARRGPRERRRPRMTTAPLLSVTDLTVTYAPPRRSGSLGHRRRPGPRRPRRPAGGDPRGRRRDRVGQDHAGPRHGRPGPPGRRPHRLRGRGPRRAEGPRAADVPPLRAGAARLPGPAARPGPRPHRRRAGRRAARGGRRRHGPSASSGSSESLGLVGLDADSFRDRYPRQLSGGQRQRVSLARAIVTRPRLLFCDEPVSALDVSNRNLVLRLLDRLRHDLGLAVVIIAHDLSSLAGVADRVAVFYRGRLVEQGPIGEVLAAAVAPLHRAAHRVGPERAAGGPPAARPAADPAADARAWEATALRLRLAVPVRPRRLHPSSPRCGRSPASPTAPPPATSPTSGAHRSRRRKDVTA